MRINEKNEEDLDMLDTSGERRSVRVQPRFQFSTIFYHLKYLSWIFSCHQLVLLVVRPVDLRVNQKTEKKDERAKEETEISWLFKKGGKNPCKFLSFGLKWASPDKRDDEYEMATRHHTNGHRVLAGLFRRIYFSP